MQRAEFKCWRGVSPWLNGVTTTDSILDNGCSSLRFSSNAEPKPWGGGVKRDNKKIYKWWKEKYGY